MHQGCGCCGGQRIRGCLQCRRNFLVSICCRATASKIHEGFLAMALLDRQSARTERMARESIPPAGLAIARGRLIIPPGGFDMSNRSRANLLVALAIGALSGCSEPARTAGPEQGTALEHAWRWRGGFAAEIQCIASPTHACYFRMTRNGAPTGTQRVAAGQSVVFNIGSAAASYCAAAGRTRGRRL